MKGDGLPAPSETTWRVTIESVFESKDRLREKDMPYSELMIRPMREELTRIGVEELRTPEDVDKALSNSEGTVMVVVNSICGCAAGKARPGIARALQHTVRPDKVATVFAGADIEATEKARSYFTGYEPSSPSIALLKDGKLVWMLERRQIEGKDASQVASELTQAFDQYCAKAEATTN
jgi:putative YphP/YqiW family bacilliredoxin